MNRHDVTTTSPFLTTGFLKILNTSIVISNGVTLGQKHAQDEKKSSLESNMFSDCIGHPALEMLKI